MTHRLCPWNNYVLYAKVYLLFTLGAEVAIETVLILTEVKIILLLKDFKDWIQHSVFIHPK